MEGLSTQHSTNQGNPSLGIFSDSTPTNSSASTNNQTNQMDSTQPQSNLLIPPSLLDLNQSTNNGSHVNPLSQSIGNPLLDANNQSTNIEHNQASSATKQKTGLLEGEFQIFVRSLAGNTLTLTVTDSTSILKVFFYSLFTFTTGLFVQFQLQFNIIGSTNDRRKRKACTFDAKIGVLQ